MSLQALLELLAVDRRARVGVVGGLAAIDLSLLLRRYRPLRPGRNRIPQRRDDSQPVIDWKRGEVGKGAGSLQ